MQNRHIKPRGGGPSSIRDDVRRFPRDGVAGERVRAVAPHEPDEHAEDGINILMTA